MNQRTALRIWNQLAGTGTWQDHLTLFGLFVMSRGANPSLQYTGVALKIAQKERDVAAEVVEEWAAAAEVLEEWAAVLCGHKIVSMLTLEQACYIWSAAAHDGLGTPTEFGQFVRFGGLPLLLSGDKAHDRENQKRAGEMLGNWARALRTENEGRPPPFSA